MDLAGEHALSVPKHPRPPRARAALSVAVAACAADAPVATPAGPVAAGRLRAGDLVLTDGGGAERILWTSPPLRAAVVEVAPGAAVTGATLVRLGADREGRLFGRGAVLCRAGDLGGPGALPRDESDCVAILLARHALIRVGAAWCGAFLPEPAALAGLPAPVRRSLRARHPRVLHAGGQAAYLPDAPVIDARERALIALLSARGSGRAGRTAAPEAGSPPSSEAASAPRCR
jgi:hypothetical protein